MNELSDDAIAQLREHEDDLRAIADADLPISWAAAAYLDALRKAEGRDARDGDESGGDGQ